MNDSTLLAELVTVGAERHPRRPALSAGGASLTYEELAKDIARFASGLICRGLARQDRVAVYLEKRFETVIAMFGTAAAGGISVPVNPVLKPPQVAYILRDCDVRILVTSPERLATLRAEHAD